MRFLRAFLSLVIVTQLSLIGCPAYAGPISVESGSIAKAEANVKSLGNLQFGSARADITNDRIDVLFTKVDLTTKRLKEEKSLTGVVLVVKTEGQGNERTITGFCYFDGGPQLSELTGSRSTGYVKTVSGQKCSGKITSVDRSAISVDTGTAVEKFPFADITEIHSPKFFKFQIPVAGMTGSAASFNGQADEMTLSLATRLENATEVKTSEKPAKPNGHHMSKKAKIITFIVMGCLVATAIAVPIAVACGTSGGRGNRNQEEALQLFAWQQFLNARRAAAPMVP